MLKVKQTIRGKTQGNCLQACLASFLEIDIDSIPRYTDHGKDSDWFTKTNEWLLQEHGYEMFNFYFDNDVFPEHLTIPVIAVGESPNYPGQSHAVILQNGKLIHDPSPTDKGLKGWPEYFITLCKDFS